MCTGVVIEKTKKKKNDDRVFIKVLFEDGRLRVYPIHDRRIKTLIQGQDINHEHSATLFGISLVIRTCDMSIVREHFASRLTDGHRKKAYGEANECHRAVCIYDPKFFNVGRGDVLLDLGSHIGAATVWFMVKGRVLIVICVEASPSNFRILNKNCDAIIQKFKASADDASAAEIKRINAAVVTEQQIECGPEGNQYHVIHSHRKISGRSTTQTPTHTHYGRTFTELKVPATTLQRLLNENPTVTAIKIDTQGNEHHLILSVKNWRKVTKIVLEYDFEYNKKYADFHAFIKQISETFPQHKSHPRVSHTTGDWPVSHWPPFVVVNLWRDSA